MIVDVQEGVSGPFGSAILVLGVGAALLAFTVREVAGAVRERAGGVRARAAAAEGRERAARPLAAGKAILLGRVELAHDAELAVRVEITQEGKEHDGSSGYSFKWTEVGRTVKVRPFYLRLRSGERVRVEPTSEVRIVDEMTGKIVVNETRRVRIAELVPDEEVFVAGELALAVDPEHQGSAYRSEPRLVLQQGRGETMLLSSLPLDEGYRRRARQHLWFALFHAVHLAAILVGGSGYLASLALGRPAVGEVLSVDVHEAFDSDDTTKYFARVRLLEAPPKELRHRIEAGDHAKLSAALAARLEEERRSPGAAPAPWPRVPLRRTPGGWVVTIGPGAVVPGDSYYRIVVMLAAFSFTLGMILLLVLGARQKAWHDPKGRLIDKGPGRLEP